MPLEGVCPSDASTCSRWSFGLVEVSVLEASPWGRGRLGLPCDDMLCKRRLWRAGLELQLVMATVGEMAGW